MKRRKQAPKWLLRFVRTCLALTVKIAFRVEITGVSNFHVAGDRVLIVSNHVSFLDGVLLYLFLPEIPTFAINTDMASRWYFKWLSAVVDRQEIDTFSPITIESLVRLVKGGCRVAIFPENRITSTGTLMKVYEGPGMVADKANAMVLPVAIEGPQYSHLSYLKGRLRLRWLPQVRITILTPRRLEVPEHVQGNERRVACTESLSAVMREISFETAFRAETLFCALIRAARRHGMGHLILEDTTGARFTYRQIILRSLLLGLSIARMTKENDRVGIMLPSTAAGVVSLFACQAVEREAAMLNFTAGVRGLTAAIETANIKLILTSRAFITVASLQEEVSVIENVCDLVYLEDLRTEIGYADKLLALIASRFPKTAYHWLSCRKTPKEPAVILFTSGSEGTPKGVVLSHENLVANFAQVSMLIDLNSQDTVLNVLPLFHAFGLLGGLFLPLFKGTKTVQYPSPLQYRIIPELCYKLGVTCLFGTTTFLRNYGIQAHPYDFYKLRFVISGAEKLTEETRALWLDKFGIRILEGYGATEASPVIAVNSPLAYRRGSVGQLLTKLDYRVDPVDGITEGGELVVRGPNIMVGYLFHGGHGEIVAPSTKLHGTGWYATGDIVNVDRANYVTILDRVKRFAKIGGEMVSLAVVEEIALAAWPAGQHAAITIPDKRKGECIVLFTDVKGAQLSDFIAAARDSAAGQLSIPRQIFYQTAIPKLGSGKVDGTALRALLSEDIDEL